MSPPSDPPDKASYKTATPPRFGAANGGASTTIGKFSVIRELGQGGMSTVFLARDPMLERLVAIKTIRLPKKADDSVQRQFLGRFIREARVIAGLDHPNIVRFYEIGEDSGQHYIAMEYLEGGSLNDLIQARTPMDLDARIDCLLQICEGVAAIHEAGLVHSDLKPHNIMLAAHGLVKIMDFGAARPLEAALSRTSQVLGTPRYMSPEQLRNQSMDHRSDIFSLGAICFELLTHEKAFPGDSILDVTKMITSSEPPPSIASATNLPPGMDEVIRKAMAKNPEERYNSCMELASDLQSVTARHRADEQAEAGFLAKEIPAGSLVFAEGEQGDVAYLLKKGRVRIFRTLEGKERELAVISPMSLFGEMALLLKDGLRTASAQTVDDVLVLEITRKDFHDLMLQSPRSIQAVLKVLVRRFKNLTEQWCAQNAEGMEPDYAEEDPLA